MLCSFYPPFYQINLNSSSNVVAIILIDVDVFLFFSWRRVIIIVSTITPSLIRSTLAVAWAGRHKLLQQGLRRLGRPHCSNFIFKRQKRTVCSFFLVDWLVGFFCPYQQVLFCVDCCWDPSHRSVCFHFPPAEVHKTLIPCDGARSRWRCCLCCLNQTTYVEFYSMNRKLCRSVWFRSSAFDCSSVFLLVQWCSYTLVVINFEEAVVDDGPWRRIFLVCQCSHRREY